MHAWLRSSSRWNDHTCSHWRERHVHGNTRGGSVVLVDTNRILNDGSQLGIDSTQELVDIFALLFFLARTRIILVLLGLSTFSGKFGEFSEGGATIGAAVVVSDILDHLGSDHELVHCVHNHGVHTHRSKGDHSAVVVKGLECVVLTRTFQDVGKRVKPVSGLLSSLLAAGNVLRVVRALVAHCVASIGEASVTRRALEGLLACVEREWERWRGSERGRGCVWKEGGVSRETTRNWDRNKTIERNTRNVPE